jgi:hypothetical protein
MSDETLESSARIINKGCEIAPDSRSSNVKVRDAAENEREDIL